jgi:hypothetical protein
VPIEVARAAFQSSVEPCARFEGRAGPPARQPQKRSRADEKEKAEVAGGGDCATGGSFFGTECEPAVYFLGRMKKCARVRRAYAEDRAGVRIQEEQLVAAE